MQFSSYSGAKSHSLSGQANLRFSYGGGIAVGESGGVMKKALLLTMFSACLGSGISVYAQNPNQPPVPSHPQQGVPQAQQAEPPANDSSDAQPVTVVGCLVKGSAEHTYTITDQKSGEKLNFSAANAIDQFLNKTVQLTGRVTSQGGTKAFIPQSAKALAPSCDTQQ
jgi:uncharacterized protein YdeI (BOF family)